MIADKFDTAAAEAIVASGDTTDPALLQWVQDLNWPVASVLTPFLARGGHTVAPGIRQVLASTDDTWKYSVLVGVVAKSFELIALLRNDLERLANEPTSGERAEELHEVAAVLLESK